MTKNEVAWLAGLLEGEGSFLIHVNRSRRTPKVQISMTDLDVIERVCALIGGINPYKLPLRVDRPNETQCYRTHLMGIRSLLLMEELRPWMGIRRGKKIDEILAYFREPPIDVKISADIRRLAQKS